MVCILFLSLAPGFGFEFVLQFKICLCVLCIEKTEGAGVKGFYMLISVWDWGVARVEGVNGR